jgi:phosphoglycerate dehydrogenase-like enzyme
MTSASALPTSSAAEAVAVPNPVGFVVALDPPDLAEHLFGRDLESLKVPGATRLNGRPVSAFDDDESRAALARADVLITGWGAPALSDDHLNAAPNLKFVLHAGGQAGGLLPASARDRGIHVSNAGWVNAIPVAEFTLAMIILANKQTFTAQRLYRDRQGYIDRELEFPAAGNAGKTIGVIGASRIGRMVIERLGDLDVDVLVYDPYLSSADAATLGSRQVGLVELMASSDVVTLHPPLNSSTVHLIGATELSAMRDGTTLINTSRGLVIDQSALVTELRTGRIQAILDVTHPEVLPVNDELYALPNVFLTPHIAGSMGAEIRRMGNHIGSELERITRGEPLAFPEALR